MTCEPSDCSMVICMCALSVSVYAHRMSGARMDLMLTDLLVVLVALLILASLQQLVVSSGWYHGDVLYPTESGDTLRYALLQLSTSRVSSTLLASEKKGSQRWYAGHIGAFWSCLALCEVRSRLPLVATRPPAPLAGRRSGPWNGCRRGGGRKPEVTNKSTVRTEKKSRRKERRRKRRKQGPNAAITAASQRVEPSALATSAATRSCCLPTTRSGYKCWKAASLTSRATSGFAELPISCLVICVWSSRSP